MIETIPKLTENEQTYAKRAPLELKTSLESYGCLVGSDVFTP